MNDMVHVDPIRDARMAFAPNVGVFDTILSFLASALLLLILSSILTGTSPFTVRVVVRFINFPSISASNLSITGYVGLTAISHQQVYTSSSMELIAPIR